MAEINFNEFFHQTLDKELLRQYVDEIIDMYGIPCKHKKWIGNQAVLDPLYQDQIILDDSEDLYDVSNTYVYVDYQRFNEVLKSYGQSIETNTSINGMMKFSDAPKEGDIIELKLPYDDVLYKFKLGSTDIHRDICYSVVLNIMYEDNN